MGFLDFWSALELGVKVGGGETNVEAFQLPQTQDTYSYR